MGRVPPDEAAVIAGVKPATLRRWVREGRLRRHWFGYDFDELIAARDARDMAALYSRAGIAMSDRPERMGA